MKISKMEAKIPRMVPSQCIFLICDIQQRFRNIIYCMESVIHVGRMMTQTAQIFNIPLLITEQNSKAFGTTTEEISAIYPNKDFIKLEKTKFSMITPEAKAFLDKFPLRKTAVLCGIEAHVCVLQTVIDLKDLGYEVFVVMDGVSSQRPIDRSTAVRRMEKMGVNLTTMESSLFEMMKDMQAQEFKYVLPILKEKRKNILPSL